MAQRIIRRTLVPLALGVVVGAGVASAASGAQHFTLTNATVNGVDKPVRVVASGPISGAGLAQIKTLRPGGSVDHVTLRLAKGTVLMTAVEKHFAVKPNYRTCTAKGTGSGTFTITGGTGAYAGATGSGTYHRSAKLIGARSSSGACMTGPKTPPKSQYVTVTFTGSANVD